MNATTTALRQMDQSHHLHPFTDFHEYAQHGGRIVSKAEHIYITDSEGHQMLDGMSGLWCCNLGYSQHAIIDAVYQQMQELPYYNNFFQVLQPACCGAGQGPGRCDTRAFNHVFFTNSGSEANDTNIRLVHRYFDLLGKPDKKHHHQPQECLSRQHHRRGLARRHEGMHKQAAAWTTFTTSTNHTGLKKVATRRRTTSVCAWRASWKPRSTSSAKTRSRPLSPSRCRAPAGSSFRPTPTGPRSSASATSATSC